MPSHSMAVACSSMEVHDRRLSVSKASAAKIGKPSPSPSLKFLSAVASSSASVPSPSSSSIASSSPSRPIATVVNADPSSFRRVVQELTGTTSSPASSHAGASPRGPSRLQRIAPPPLRTSMRSASFPQPAFLDQMQHPRAPQMLLLQQHMQKVGSLSPPLSFPEVSSSISYPTPLFGNLSSNPASEQASLLEDCHPSDPQSLPMLSPHLLLPLPALTPGDISWAKPIEMTPHSPQYAASEANSLPSLQNLQSLTSSNSNSFHGEGVLAKSESATKKGVFDGAPARPQNSVSFHGQSLSPLLPSPLQGIGFNAVLPPWSPSPLPFSPVSFPPSPGLGPPAATVSPKIDNLPFDSQTTHGSSNPRMSSNFTF